MQAFDLISALLSICFFSPTIHFRITPHQVSALHDNLTSIRLSLSRSRVEFESRLLSRAQRRLPNRIHSAEKTRLHLRCLLFFLRFASMHIHILKSSGINFNCAQLASEFQQAAQNNRNISTYRWCLGDIISLESAQCMPAVRARDSRLCIFSTLEYFSHCWLAA